ncbi:MAG: hypothetical protein A2020_04270 [Lentisphaerae bacterium GWF2_45_14]|nr:MAG: hypothetical protein A2020_04270 [Lentisphaerae bacterium GWF2_45_14]
MLFPLVAAFFAFLPSSVARSDADPEVFSYISCGTFEYNGKANFRVQNAGIIDVMRQKVADDDFSYTFMTRTKMMLGDNQKNAEIESPPFIVARDKANSRLTGGLDCLKDFGDVGNEALALTGSRVITDNKWRHYDLPMGTTKFYPTTPGINVKYRYIESKTLGPCVLTTASTDFFVCEIPDEKRFLSGMFKVVMLSDPTMRKMYYRCSGYEARSGDEQVNAKDNFWLSSSQTGGPVNISDIRSELDAELASIYMPDKGILKTDTTVPPWAVHALSVKRYMDTVTGAVIEGQPNFAIMATIAGVLLVDSAVSLGSEVLAWGVKKAFNKDIPVYQGIPNYIGQGIGWGSSKIYEKATGNKADTAKWKKIGGDISDIASMFISPRIMNKGIQVIGKSVKFIDSTVDALRIGKHALSIKVVDMIGKFFNWKTGIQKILDYAPSVTGLWGGGSGGTTPGAPGSSGGQGGSSGGARGPPGGITFEGDAGNLDVKTVSFFPTENKFMINGGISYKNPLRPSSMAAVMKHVADDETFGVSLAGRIAGESSDAEIRRVLELCDRFLGNVIFGRPEKVPEGCKIDPAVRLESVSDDKLGTICVHFSFKCILKVDGSELKRDSASIGIELLPNDPAKAKSGTYEYADKSVMDKTALNVYEKNKTDFNQNYYMSLPAVENVVDYAEAVAFARSLRRSGVDLKRLSSEILLNSKD